MEGTNYRHFQRFRFITLANEREVSRRGRSSRRSSYFSRPDSRTFSARNRTSSTPNLLTSTTVSKFASRSERRSVLGARRGSPRSEVLTLPRPCPRQFPMSEKKGWTDAYPYKVRIALYLI
jgi:hypothetical protein